MLELPQNRSRSPKEQVALLPKVDRDRLLLRFTAAQLQALRSSWRSWNARPSQVAPHIAEVTFLHVVPGRYRFVSTLGKSKHVFELDAERGDTPESFRFKVASEWRRLLQLEQLDGKTKFMWQAVVADDALHLVSLDHNRPEVEVDGPRGSTAVVEYNRWRTWLVQAGRGFGKTRLGAEWAIEQARSHPKVVGASKGALIGATPEEVAAVMVHGESGILACSPRDFYPEFFPAKEGGKLVWPNGVEARVFSGSNPQKLRGPNLGWAWVDEAPKFSEAEETWRQLNMCLRVGEVRCLITTTPAPRKVMQDVINSPRVVRTRGHSFENSSLPEATVESWQAMYGSTRFGRQELEGELLLDTQGALWTQASVQRALLHNLPETFLAPTKDGRGRSEQFRLVRTVVAVDPAVRPGGQVSMLNAETGIMVGALGNDGNIYVLSDRSGDWTVADGSAAKRVVEAYRVFGAQEIVVEQNNGGDWIPAVIKALDPTVNIKMVVASKGKVTRAEPVSALYEQGRVFHVATSVKRGIPDPQWGDLFRQLTSWLPGEKSPDRLDALVWLVSSLAGIDAKKMGGGQRVGKPRSVYF